MLDLSPIQLEMLPRIGQSTKLDPDKYPYEWQCIWDSLWLNLYKGWLDGYEGYPEAAWELLKLMSQTMAERSARFLGIGAGVAVLLAPLQEELLVSLHLPAVIYTGMPVEEWNGIKNALLAAVKSTEGDYLFEDTYSYIQLCFDTVHAMEQAERRAELGPVAEIIDDLLEYKHELAFALLTKYDPLGLTPGEPYCADVDAYIWEGEVIGDFVFKCNSLARAIQVIVYVLSRSFEVDIEGQEVNDLARELLERMPDDLIEPETFPSFEHDIMPLIDRRFAYFEEYLPKFTERAREIAIQEGLQPEDYADRINVHFLTTFMTNYGVKKYYTGEVRRPRVKV